MTQEEIIAGNKLIAEFDGFKISKSGKTLRKDNYSSPYRRKDIKYHSSWDWLMPVVEKIDNSKASIFHGFQVYIGRGYCRIDCYEPGKQTGIIYQTPYSCEEMPRIQAVWLGVVDFIKWFNTQTR